MRREVSFVDCNSKVLAIGRNALPYNSRIGLGVEVSLACRLAGTYSPSQVIWGVGPGRVGTKIAHAMHSQSSPLYLSLVVRLKRRIHPLLVVRIVLLLNRLKSCGGDSSHLRVRQVWGEGLSVRVWHGLHGAPSEGHDGRLLLWYHAGMMVMMVVVNMAILAREATWRWALGAEWS